jgi:ribosomal protein S12 methylthiotransferase accessory factor
VNGSGCHPDKGIALCRALTEAAQSRLTSIAGSRDDITTGGHRAQKLAEGLQEYEALARAPLSRSFDATPHWSGASIDDDLDRVMGCLAERGMTSALVVDLSSPGFDMAFARTLVPGLESSIASPSYLPRARAQQRLA